VVLIKTLLLAAGYATRLYPLTKDTPKPLLLVAGKPLIEHQLEKIEQISEIDEVVVVTNHKFISHFQQWQSSYTGRLKLTVVDDGSTTDEDKLGPIGDVQFGIEQAEIEDELLIIAGDNLFGFSLDSFIVFFKEKQCPVLALVDLKDPALLANKFGVGEVDAEGKLLSFEEKPAKPKSTFAATACYLLRKQDLATVDDMVREAREGAANLNAGDLIIELLNNNSVFGFVFSEHWFDIGGLEEYKQANAFYEGNQ
jgi:glucose-1-phosphate thymidylyltransferase